MPNGEGLSISMARRCRQINCCGRGKEDEERLTSPRLDCDDCPSGRWEDGQSGRRVERWRRGDQGRVFPARNGRAASPAVVQRSAVWQQRRLEKPTAPNQAWNSEPFFRCLFGVSAEPRPFRNIVLLWVSKACSQSIPSLSLTDESGHHVSLQTTTSSMYGTALQAPHMDDFNTHITRTNIACYNTPRLFWAFVLPRSPTPASLCMSTPTSLRDAPHSITGSSPRGNSQVLVPTPNNDKPSRGTR